MQLRLPRLRSAAENWRAREFQRFLAKGSFEMPLLRLSQAARAAARWRSPRLRPCPKILSVREHKDTTRHQSKREKPMSASSSSSGSSSFAGLPPFSAAAPPTAAGASPAAGAATATAPAPEIKSLQTAARTQKSLKLIPPLVPNNATKTSSSFVQGYTVVQKHHAGCRGGCSPDSSSKHAAGHRQHTKTVGERSVSLSPPQLAECMCVWGS